MMYLLAFISVALVILAWMENPNRVYERQERACVKACTRRTPKRFDYNRPSYRWYY